jgi:hypothetical protein
MSGTGVEGPLDEHVKSPRTLRVAPPSTEPEIGDPAGHSVGAIVEFKEPSGLWRAGRQSVTLRLPMNPRLITVQGEKGFQTFQAPPVMLLQTVELLLNQPVTASACILTGTHGRIGHKGIECRVESRIKAFQSPLNHTVGQIHRDLESNP